MAKELNVQIKALLEEYGAEAEEAVKEVIPKVAKEAAKKLRATSPKKTGEYAKGWTQKVTQTRLGSEAVVYNKNKPGLAHLLEFGHAKRNGGRTKAIEHVLPVYSWAQTEAQKRIEEALKK